MAKLDIQNPWQRLQAARFLRMARADANPHNHRRALLNRASLYAAEEWNTLRRKARRTRNPQRAADASLTCSAIGFVSDQLGKGWDL